MIADERYLDGRDGGVAAEWAPHSAKERARLLALYRDLPPVKDDFVRVPLPRLAAGSAGADAAVGAALIQYAAEAKVVDTRLFRKVTLQQKGASLTEVCADLQRQTGVRFQVTRGVGDEKVTALLEDLPARDVMRELARLYGYFWSRTGEEGAYKYTLEQDLRSQLAEEEMRNQDVNSALLSLDAQMQADQPLTELSLAELRKRQQNANGTEAEHLNVLARGGWGGLLMYHRLTPAERVQLRTQGRLVFTLDNPNPSLRLPAELKQPLLESSREAYFREDGSLQADADLPGAQPIVVLSINRSELGEMTLNCDAYAAVPGRGGSSVTRTLARGKSASTERPDNAALNAKLKNAPELQKKVSLAPVPSCPYAEDGSRNSQQTLGMTFGTHYLGVGYPLPHPHLNSADVWAEVHKQTGLPILADFYSRIYDPAPFKAEKTTAFQALCQAADNLGARWRKEGGFILARNTGYFWDKLKEVPRHYLARWAEDARARGGLPLEDLVEMSTLQQQQLDSVRVGEMIRHCWGLEEWMIVGGGDENGTNGWRGRLRALAALSPAQLQAAQTAGGLEMGGLAAGQQEALRHVLYWLAGVPDLAGARLRVEYVPSGWRVWVPVVSKDAAGPLVERLKLEPIVAARTPEEVLNLGRKFLPETQAAGDVRRSTGIVALTVTLPDGKTFSDGRPSVLVKLN